MPLKLVPPRPGKTPFWYVRGTYLGHSVDRSTRVGDRRKAQQILNRIKEDIERGAITGTGALTFAQAALSYVRAGGERRFLEALAKHFGVEPVANITQARIDAAADALYQNATPATRNRQVYTPIVAILRHAGVPMIVNRPKGSQGQQRQGWLDLEQAAKLLKAAPNATFSALVTFLLYTGCRLGEALALRWETVDLARSAAVAPKTKNGQPRALHLTADVVAALANLPGEHDKGSVFGLTKGAGVYKPWRTMAAKAELPWVTPHVLRHTYATWLRIYAGADLKALIETGAWRDLKSVARYTHAVPTEAARKADLLPSVENSGTTKLSTGKD